MKTIGIIVAMDKEMALLKERIVQAKCTTIMNQPFYCGEYAMHQVVFTTAGIGKVNASIITTLMIEHFQPDLIINSGIAGGYLQTLKPLDTVVATKVLYSDVDMTSPMIGGLPFGQMEGSPKCFLPNAFLCKGNALHFGTILSGDQFVDNYAKTKQLVDCYFSDYDVIAVDMESSAISHVCTKFNVPFLIIRSISDLIGKSNEMDYDKFSYLASNKSCDVVLNIIQSI